MEWLFRVWNPSTKTMVYNVNEINLGNNVVANIEDGKLVVQFIKEEESNINWITTKPQFYSGMNDMNSKKIFANDIIEVNDKFLRGKRLKVIFDNGCFGFKDGIRFIPLYRYEWTLIKVIGNADANPELL